MSIPSKYHHETPKAQSIELGVHYVRINDHFDYDKVRFTGKMFDGRYELEYIGNGRKIYYELGSFIAKFYLA